MRPSDSLRLPVADLLKAGGSESLAQRVAAADTDGGVPAHAQEPAACGSAAPGPPRDAGVPTARRRRSAPPRDRGLCALPRLTALVGPPPSPFAPQMASSPATRCCRSARRAGHTGRGRPLGRQRRCMQRHCVLRQPRPAGAQHGRKDTQTNSLARLPAGARVCRMWHSRRPPPPPAQVFASELRMRRSKKRLTWALVASTVACLLLLAANAGLTYAGAPAWPAARLPGLLRTVLALVLLGSPAPAQQAAVHLLQLRPT